MNPGVLDRRVTFGTFTSVETVDQDYEITFVPVLETWAKVRTVSGKRQLEAGEDVITETAIITIRYRVDFFPTKDMRILYNGNYYTLHSIDDKDDRRRFVEISARVTDENGKSTGT